MNDRERITELFGRALAERLEQRRVFAGRHPEPGTIWRTVEPPAEAEHAAPLVLVVEAYAAEETGEEQDRFSVARVRSGVQLATSEDAVLEPAQTGLDFRALICVADVFPLRREDLAACVGELDEDILDEMLDFCLSFGMSARDESPENVHFFADVETGAQLIRFGELVTGTPVDSPDDPRAREIARLIEQRGYLLGFLLESEDWVNEPEEFFGSTMPAASDSAAAIVISLDFGPAAEAESARDDASRSLVALAADSVADSDYRPDAAELETRLRLLERLGNVEFLADEADQVHIVVEQGPRLCRLFFDEEDFELEETVIPSLYLVKELFTIDFFELYNESSELRLLP